MDSSARYHSLVPDHRDSVKESLSDVQSVGSPTSVEVDHNVKQPASRTRLSASDGLMAGQQPSEDTVEEWCHDNRPTAGATTKKPAALDKRYHAGWWSRLTDDGWTIEFLAAFVSCASLASIIGILATYNNNPVPPLMKGITLNAVISFLATISRTSIMLCIGTVVAQAKWLWFKKKRSLIDLLHIENASRGPLGSLILLFNARGGIVCGSAAILTLAALIFDPFIQQLLSTHAMTVAEPADGVFINVTTSNLPGYAMTYPETVAELAEAMLINIQQYQNNPRSRAKRSYASESVISTPLQASCPSGNCVWPKYYALDICTACRPTTSEVIFRNVTYSPWALIDKTCADPRSSCYDPYVGASAANWTWEIEPRHGNKWTVNSSITGSLAPGGQGGSSKIIMVRKLVWPLNFAGLSYGTLNVSGWTRQSFAGIDAPVASIGFAEFKADGAAGVPKLNRSLECALTYCVKQFNRSVIQGSLETNITAIHYGSVVGDDINQQSLVWSTIVNGTNFSTPLRGYGVIIDTMVNFFLGHAIHAYEGGCGVNSASCNPRQVDNSGSYASHPDAWQGIDLTDDFSTVLKNTEFMMSQIIQRYGENSISGANAVTKQFVNVRWPWITLPASVVILGIAILSLTVWESASSRAPNWKSSLFPLLYRYGGLDRDDARSSWDDKSVAGIKRKPVPGDTMSSSNTISRLALEAEATVAQIITTSTVDRIWQLRTIKVRHEAERRWWHRLKWWS